MTVQTLTQINSFVQSTIKLTTDRIKVLNSAKREDPHIKLLIIDLVNYLTSLLQESDRRSLIEEMYDNQLGLESDVKLQAL